MKGETVKTKDGKEKYVSADRLDEENQESLGLIAKQIGDHCTCLDIFRDLMDVVKTDKG